MCQRQVHAFSPLEVWQGAATLGLPLEDYLTRLRDAGLGSLPGTAAEVLDDSIRAVLCPDKINTAQWLQVNTRCLLMHRNDSRSKTVSEGLERELLQNRAIVTVLLAV